MPYHEASFLNGLAAGLAATNGQPLAATRQTLLTGISRISNVPTGNFDTFVSKVSLRTRYPVTILYEYGPANGTLTRDVRRVGPSEETQTLYHVCQTPEALSLRNFRYSAYLTERDDMNIRFEARFMSFPYASSGTSRPYPGSPELVSVWWTRTVR